jgi:hypothetical protein
LLDHYIAYRMARNGDLARSALPDAPVVPDRPARVRQRLLRRVAAAALRQVAERLEPAPRPSIRTR